MERRNSRGGSVKRGKGKCPLCDGRAEASASCTSFGEWSVAVECGDCGLYARATHVKANSGKEATRTAVDAWRAMRSPLNDILQGGDSDEASGE